MKSQRFLGLVAPPVFICIIFSQVVFAQALTFSPFDTDGNGSVSATEAEAGIIALEGRIDQNARRQREVLKDILVKPKKERSLGLLEEIWGIQPLCDPNPGFLLRKRIQGEAVAICANSGESFSFGFSDDNKANTEKLTIDGAVGVVLTRKPLGLGRSAQWSLLAFAEAIELEYNTGSDNPDANADEGQIRLGLQAEFDFALPIPSPGGGLDVVLSPYYFTDAKLEADGKGVVLAFRPQINRWRLNSRFKGKPLYWKTALTFDYLDVGNAGVSGLDNDTEYFWVEGSLGAFYEKRKADEPKVFSNGYLASLSGTVARDLNEDNILSQWLAAFEIYLDPSAKTRLRFQYARGDTRSEPEPQDKFTIALGVKF